MAFNANFINARLDGGSVVVSGTTKPALPLPIMVTLAHKGHLRAQEVDGSRDDPWQVTFGATDPPFATGDEVHVTGVAVRPDEPEPFVWQGSFDLADRSASPA